jgi:hypothetical protein
MRLALIAALALFWSSRLQAARLPSVATVLLLRSARSHDIVVKRSVISNVFDNHHNLLARTGEVEMRLQDGAPKSG